MLSRYSRQHDDIAIVLAHGGADLGEGSQAQFLDRPVFNNIRGGMGHDQGKDQTLLMPEYRDRLQRATSVRQYVHPDQIRKSSSD